MHILVLGGTRFLGRHLVDAARARGHEVTLFNRGRSAPALHADLERLRGDRDGGLDVLKGRRFDAVVDTSGYVPRVVRASARLLAEGAGHYTFVSSVSAYRDLHRIGIDESHPVGTLADESVEEITGDTYGPLKALCEREVERAFPGRSLIVRPGLVVGPHDPTDRFTYWPRRVARGGEVLVPSGRHLPVQIVDARDLAGWMVGRVEARTAGVFNATGPAEPLDLGRLLDACSAVAGSAAAFTWVEEAFLLEHGVEYWRDLPAVLPESDRAHAGMLRVDSSRALRAGFVFRPLAETVADTLRWDTARPPDAERQAGLAPEREAALLAAWRERLAGARPSAISRPPP